jgi:hypothetical protein
MKEIFHLRHIKIAESFGCTIGDDTDDNGRYDITYKCGHIGKMHFSQLPYILTGNCPSCNHKNAGERNKLPEEEVIRFVTDNGLIFYKLDYNGKIKKLRVHFADEDGYKYYSNYTDIKRNILVRNFYFEKFSVNNIYTIENIQHYLELNAPRYHISLDENYSGNAKKMTFYDDDGYFYYTTLNLIQSTVSNGGFSKMVDKSNIYSLKNIELWIEKNNKPYKLIEGQKYVSSTSPLKFKCFICNPEEDPFTSNWSEIMSGYGCNFCTAIRIGKCNNLKFKFPEVAELWNYEKNFPVRPEDVAPATSKRFYWLCPDCGRTYPDSPAHKTSGENRGCHFCYETNGEKRVRKFLEKKLDTLSFNPQHKFDDCVYQRRLEFDFYINMKDGRNIICEYMGPQHYFPVSFGSWTKEETEANFLKIKIKDDIKIKYCEKNNIEFIEIPYWDYKNIERILNSKLYLQRKEEKVFG